ncbi:MAG TPA: hypothetical protein VHW90_14225 [Stellaceae bacterium]|nr:hypothetical protein [Stellaceae bacterium]
MTAGEPVALRHGPVQGASVSATADPGNGCLGLFFTPPPGNTEPWEITAHIDFARAP